MADEHKTDQRWRKCRKRPVIVHVRDAVPGEELFTREGLTLAKDDDLVMRGVEGEIYPIGREIFERTYDIVDDLESQVGPEAASHREPGGWRGAAVDGADDAPTLVEADEVLRLRRLLDALVSQAGPESLAADMQELERARAALRKINELRNSIVGSQSVGWSRHIYPLVAALNEAGYQGLEYEQARAKETGELVGLPESG